MSAAPPRTMPDFSDRHHSVHAATALMILKRMGIDLERVDLLSHGEHEIYRNEIQNQTPDPGEDVGPHDRVELRLNKYSSVDHLPYQFFYGLDQASITKSGDWDERARRLMAPFDAAIMRRLASAQFEELRFDMSVADSDHIARFVELFGFDAGQLASDFRESLLWTAMLPYFHQWSGNPDKVEQALECLFGYEFSIIENVPARYDIPASLQYQLGSPTDRLGYETVLGDSFTECDTCYGVIVKGVAAKDLSRFMPGRPGRKKLEDVLDICMPSDLDRVITIEPRDRQASLGSSPGGSYLGYNSFV